MTLETVVSPAVPVFTFDDVNAQLSLEEGEIEDQALIEGYILAATARVQNYLRRRLITQDVQLLLDGSVFDHGCEVGLQLAPLLSVEQVEYLDRADEWQTMDVDTYQLVRSVSPAVLLPAPGTWWPTTSLNADAVRITIRVGYGPSPDAVPDDIKQALRFMIAHMYRYREATTDGEIDDGLMSVKAFLDPYRVWV